MILAVGMCIADLWSVIERPNLVGVHRGPDGCGLEQVGIGLTSVAVGWYGSQKKLP